MANVLPKRPHLSNRYQRFSKEANQAMRIQSVKAKTFKEAADNTRDIHLHHHSSIFQQAKAVLPRGVRLPKAIAIDEFKADTDAGKYQLIIANAETHEPIDILPNRRLETIKTYLTNIWSRCRNRRHGYE